MKRILLLLFFIGISLNKMFSQTNPIDSIKVVSLDAGYTYIPFGNYDVGSIKDLLDNKIAWSDYFRYGSDIEYNCVIVRKDLIKKFEKLITKSSTSSYVDLSNFNKINVRIGLKIYRGSEVDYMFIQPKSSDYFDKFIITETKELHASNNLIRFLKKMKNNKRCQRC